MQDLSFLTDLAAPLIEKPFAAGEAAVRVARSRGVRGTALVLEAMKKPRL